MDPLEISRVVPILTLAYLGDAAYELKVRTYLARDGAKPEKLHRLAKRFVSASAQSKMVEVLLPLLDETETQIYHRGRNAKSHSHPKNVDLSEYHRATGFEAVWGYLHLAGDEQRLEELFDAILKTNSAPCGANE